jgi:hypothetical protein
MKKLLLLTSFLSISLFSCEKIESDSLDINSVKPIKYILFKNNEGDIIGQYYQYIIDNDTLTVVIRGGGIAIK